MMAIWAPLIPWAWNQTGMNGRRAPEPHEDGDIRTSAKTGDGGHRSA